MKHQTQKRATTLLIIAVVTIVAALWLATIFNPAHAQLDPIEMLQTAHADSNPCLDGKKPVEYILARYKGATYSPMESYVTNQLSLGYVLYGPVVIDVSGHALQPMVKCR